MKIVNKKNKKNKFATILISNYISVIVLGISGFAINIIIAKFYNPETLGVFNQVLATYIVFSMFGSGGINYSVLRAIASNSKNDETIKSIIKGGIILTLLIGFITSVAYFFLIPPICQLLKSESVSIGMRLICPGIFFFSINKVLLNGVINGLQLMNKYAFYQCLRYTLILSSTIIFVLFSIDGNKLPIVFTISELILFINLIVIISIENYWFESKDWFIWFKTHIIYGYKSFISGLILEFNTRVDILILGIFLEDKDVGIYSFAALFAEGLIQLLFVIQNIYNPILANLISSNKLEKLKNLIYSLKKRIFISATLIWISSILIFTKIIAVFANNQDYQRSYLPFVFLISGITLSSGYIPFNNILLMANLPGKQTKLMILVVIFNISLNFLLIPFYGLVGASIATGFAFILAAYLLKQFTKDYIGFKL